MSQTSVSSTGQAVGVAGQLFDNAEVVDVVSGFSEEASAQIPFGVGLKQGAADQGVLNMAGSTDVVAGISVFGYNHMPANAAGTIGDLGTTGLLPKAGLQVLRKGRILALLDAGVASVAVGDRAYVRYSANGGNTVLGAWSNATDAGHNTDMTKVGVFVSSMSTAADGTSKLAVLEVDFTNKP